MVPSLVYYGTVEAGDWISLMLFKTNIEIMKNNTNQTRPEFDVYDRNLWFNVIVFIVIFFLLAVSFLIFRGMKKSSKNSNDIYAGDYSDEENKNEAPTTEYYSLMLG